MANLQLLKNNLEIAKQKQDEDYLYLAEKFNTILELEMAFENLYSVPEAHDFEGISVSQIISALHYVRKTYLEKDLGI